MGSIELSRAAVVILRFARGGRQMFRTAGGKIAT